MFPSEQFDLNPVLDSKFVLRMMSYLMLSLSKTNTNKRFDAPVISNSGNSQVLHRDNFVRFKVTCKGPHKFGITKQLSDNTLW